VSPLDEVLGIDRLPFKMTPQVTCEVARLSVINSSYENAQSALKSSLGFDINDDTMRKVTDFVGKIVYDNDLENARKIVKEIYDGNFKFTSPKIDGILYLEAGSTMLPTRTSGAKGLIYKESKLGIAFTSSDIITYSDKNGIRKHEVFRKEFVASLGEYTEFSHLLFSLAFRNGYGRYKSTVLLSDGSAWIRKIQNKYFTNLIHILDLYYIKNHIANIGQLLFDNDQEKSKTWIDEIINLFLQNKTDKAIDSILKSTNNRFKEHIDKFINYIDNNKDIIDYAAYIKNGIFVGSGAIENANKGIIQRRMKTRSSTRWSPESGQAVITLLTKLESGSWSDVVKTVHERCGEPLDRLQGSASRG
jgi:hypothetical protein